LSANPNFQVSGDPLNYAFLNDRFLPVSDAVIPAASRAASYGDGCFETLKTWNGRMLALDRHVARLNRGLDYLGITHPRESTEARFAYIIDGLLDRNQLLDTEARVRIQVWRMGPLGYQTPDLSEAMLLVNVFPIGNTPPPSHIGLVERRRIPNASLPTNLKLSNGLNYILAQREAQAAGYQEGVMCTVGGHLSETTTANLFWLKGDTLFTPHPSCDILEGIMRSLVIEALDGLIRIEECSSTPDALETADAVFSTNSLRELHPIAKYNTTGYDLDSPLVQKLLKRWADYRNDVLI
jgi:branched-subunit amino acid aminotransferase/4-amino-4-deoxychorismate lyase